MTRTRKLTSALLTVALAFAFAVSALTVSFGADEKNASVQQTIYVIQLITGTADPEEVDGVYVIMPTNNDVLPVNEKGETVTRWEINGNRYEKAYFNFDEPGMYEYKLAKLKAASENKADKDLTDEDFEEGTYTEPLTHIFGFVVEKQSDGTLVATPHTCEDPQIQILPNGDGKFPKGLTIWNYVYAQKEDPVPPTEPSTEPSSKPTSSSTKKSEGCTCTPGAGCNCGNNSGCNCSGNKGCSCTTTSKKDDSPSSSSSTQAELSTKVEPITDKSGVPVTTSGGVIQTTIKYVNSNSNANVNGNANSNSNSGSSGTTSTRKGSGVNTGDPHQMILWVVILGVAAVGLIVVFFIRRKQDDEDDE